jgi:hypothetical protein
MIYLLHSNGQDFEPVQIQQSQLNVLQIATARSSFSLVRYILEEHKTFNHQKQFKYIDPRFILNNQYQPSDETLTIRLAI